METDKFEKHIKSQFKDREIQPSENAWAKVSSELNTDESNKKPVYLWMGIAASVMVLIGFTIFFFNSLNNVNETQFKIVDGNAKKTLEIEKTIKTEPFQEKEQVVIAKNDTFEQEEINVDEKQTFVSKKENNVIKDAIVVAIVEKVTPQKLANKLGVSDDVINTKVSDIVAQINVLEQHTNVTDAEVDSLLKRAQQEILHEKIFNTNKSVNAMALLTEVEGELDQSFRDQIFNSLKASFIKVRTAVADRNN